MIERIKNSLKKIEIADYTIHEMKQESVECFFIRRNLDVKRRTNLLEYTVTVFCPFEKMEEELSVEEKLSMEKEHFMEGEHSMEEEPSMEVAAGKKKMLGSSSVQLYPEMDEEEITTAIQSAYHAASFVENPWYELVSGTAEEFVPSSGTLAGHSPEENMKKMSEALFAAEENCGESVFLNSTEIFSKRIVRRIVNSRGVDVSYETCEVFGEYVVQCVEPQDVETYHDFSYRDLDTEALRKDVEEALEMTQARARAFSAPAAGTYRVILSGEQMRTFFQYYVSRSGSGMIYQKYSSYRIGTQVQGENVRGDSLTITLKAVEPYSHEGIPMKDRPLVDNGVLTTIHGDSRFAYYLGIEPTGNYRCISVPVGSTPLSQMKTEAYLHIISFSDFQMDSFSGHFGGEIRLAFLYNRDTVTPVTGGSVNGSIMEVQGNMVFSKERYKNGNYEGPFAVSLEGVQVAGV